MFTIEHTYILKLRKNCKQAISSQWHFYRRRYHRHCRHQNRHRHRLYLQLEWICVCKHRSTFTTQVMCWLVKFAQELEASIQSERKRMNKWTRHRVYAHAHAQRLLAAKMCLRANCQRVPSIKLRREEWTDTSVVKRMRARTLCDEIVKNMNVWCVWKPYAIFMRCSENDSFAHWVPFCNIYCGILPTRWL